MIPLCGSLPLKYSLISSLIFGILVEPPTKTILSISVFFFLASSRAFPTGTRVFLNKSALSSSNFDLVKVSVKSKSSYKFSISIVYSNTDDKDLLAFSTSLLSFYIDPLSAEISTLYFFLMIFI